MTPSTATHTTPSAGSPSADTEVLRFGGFELDPRTEELRRGGARVKLQAQPFKVLQLLARRWGDVVTREEIQEHVWGLDTHVDFEQGINVCIRQIRQALGETATSPRFIETVPRKGYRFVSPVERVAPVEEGMPGTGVALPAAGSGAVLERPPAEPPVGTATASSVASRRLPLGWWLAAAVGGVVIGALVLGWMVSGEAEAPGSGPVSDSVSASAPVAGAIGTPRVPRLVVLPFEHLGPPGEGEHLADGLTEEVITELVRGYGGRLGVIARTTSMKYRGSVKSVAEIAAELRVDWVLEGSVRREGDRVRVTAQLIGADDLHRWANEYDRDLPRERVADLELQATVAETVARAVGLNLGMTEPEGSPGHGTTSPEAWRAYLEGKRWLAPAERPDPERALAELRRAVELDPAFAAGWLGVHRALTQRPGPLSPRERGQAREALERALVLDESMPEAHRLRALFAFYVEWDRETARASWQRALEMAPHFSEAHHDLAAWYSVTGDHERALVEVDRALALDPRSPGVHSDVGWYSYFARRPREAVERCRETLEIEPGYFWAAECILLGSLAAGDLEGARARALRSMREAEAPAEAVARVAGSEPEEALRVYARWGVEELRVLESRRSVPYPAQLATRHLMLGDADGALEELERAFRLRDGWILPFLPVHPLFDPLRDDPRFEELVRRISGEEGLRLSRAQPRGPSRIAAAAADPSR